LVFDSLLSYFDRDIDVGGGATAISISRTLLHNLIATGVISRALGDRLSGLAIVLQTSERGTVIKTIVRGRLDHRFGHYVRQRKKPARIRGRRRH
jgi:hypothetical protein